MTAPTPPPIYDADELRAKAEAATPGPWVDDGNGIGKVHDREPWHEQVVGLETVGSPYMEYETLVLRETDREFIAAANPAVVLALLDERATLLARVEAAEAERDQYKALAQYRAEQQLQADKLRDPNYRIGDE